MNKKTQELIQSDPTQALKTKIKTDKYNKAATKTDGKQSWKHFPKGRRLCYPNLTEYIINLHNYKKKKKH